MNEERKMGKIERFAEIDTPEAVTVGGSRESLIIWFVGRYGILAIVTLIFAYATRVVYFDMRNDREELMRAYKDNTEAITNFNNTVQTNTKAIKESLNYIQYQKSNYGK